MCLFKYASWLSAHFVLIKIRVHTLFFKHIMHSQFLRMHDFFTLDIQCQFVNILLKRLKRLSHFIIHVSSVRLNIKAKQLVVDVKNNVV